MDYYNQIKGLLITNEIHKNVKDFSKNKSDLDTYYNVGKILIDSGNKYGEGIIKEYSLRLTKELGLGYSQRNLRNMRQFYKVTKKWQTMSAKLSWSHYCEILWFDNNKFQYYVNIVEQNNLSIRQLRERIKSKEYERLPIETKNKIINNTTLELGDEIKNPIIINNKCNIDVDNIKEKVLQELILDDLSNFLKQLGPGFSYIENEYKIRIGNNYNYIDILLYNVIYHSYVVVELKVTELKKEHIGQVMIYMNYIDENIKQISDNKTIGLIVVKENNNYIIKYSSDNRIKSVEYKII